MSTLVNSFQEGSPGESFQTVFVCHYPPYVATIIAAIVMPSQYV